MIQSLKNTFAAAAILSFLAFGFVTTASAACTVFGLPGVAGIQQAVNQVGYTPMLVADGKFGPKTKAGVMWAQGKIGGLTTDGAWGPKTNAAYVAWASNCDEDDNSDDDNNSGDLEGDFGTISDVDTLSQYSSEDVGEGEEEVIIAGLEVEASNDGDIMLTSMKVTFDQTGNGSGDSDKLDDYIDGVTIWMGDEEIATADVDDFTENSNDTYSKTIALDDSIIRSDDSEKFYISVDSAGNLDSGDIDSDSWTVVVNNLRYEDGDGVVTTDTDSGDLGATGTGIGTNGTAGDGVPFDFVTFSAAADTELKITTDSDSPEAGIVMVEDDDSTDEVSMLKGELELEGDSDATLDDFVVTITTSGATDVDEVTGSLTLVIDGEEYTESVSTSAVTTASVTFDNMDFDIEAGDTISFEVLADINDLETGLFEAGDMLKVDVSSTNRGHFDIENEEGDQLDDSTEKSGTATGEYQEFRTNGIMVELVEAVASATDSTTSGADVGTFEITFEVTAVGDAVYLATVVGNGYTYVVDDSGVATTGGLSAVVTNNDDTDLTATYNWLIEDGQTEEITLTVVRQAPPTDSGLYRAVLSGVKWDTDDDQTPDNTYTSNLDSFATNYITLN